MTVRSTATAGAIALALFATSTSSEAQPSQGMQLNRYDAPVHGSDWFGNESLDLRGHLRPFAGFMIDWAHKPLVIYDTEGNEVTSVVANQVYRYVGGGMILFDRVRAAMNFPVNLYTGGDGGTVNGTQFVAEEGLHTGDIRLSLDARIIGDYTGPVTFAGGVQVHFPTGTREGYAGDGSTRIVPRLMVAGDVNIFTYAARLGVHVRTEDENFAGQPFGSEVNFAASAGVRLVERKLTVGPEIYGSTVVSDGGDGAFGLAGTPLEIMFGAHYRFHPDWQVGGGVAPGLTQAFGSPVVRTVASISWMPEFKKKAAPPPKPKPKPKDRDGDGVIDSEDRCPDQPGPASNQGCPPDSDGDGIIDAQDACPQKKGVPSDDPSKHGCPPPDPDGDGDGIPDKQDACPMVKGVASNDPSKHGCPPDTDGDGITDDLDACPKVPGVASNNPKRNGCPKAVVVGKQIKILERVEFDTARATLRPSAEPILREVLAIMKKHDTILLLSIEGHTDNQGNKFFNLNLSKRRARTVKNWLIKNGIARNRLVSTGFGQKKPIDTNDTDEGRQNNRRVEFHIKKGGAREVKTK